jgi:hypothetical protein
MTTCAGAHLRVCPYSFAFRSYSFVQQGRTRRCAPADLLCKSNPFRILNDPHKTRQSQAEGRTWKKN